MGSTSSNSAPLPATNLAGSAGVPRLYGEIIQDDRICPGCSYNLKGLRTGERCPECASPIPMKVGTRHGWMMTQSPVEYLRGLSHGCMWMLGGGGGLTVCLLWAGIALAATGAFPLIVACMAIFAGAGWVLGVFKVTTHRPQEPGNPGTRVAEWRGLRWIARVSQCAWIACAICLANFAWLLSQAAPDLTQLNKLLGGAILLAFIGVIGLVPLAYYLALLANWADDSALARKLRMTPLAFFGAVVIAGLMVLIRPLLHNLPFLFVLIPTLAVGAGLFLLCFTHFGIALIQFANIGIWAEHNASTALDSDRRRSAKIVSRIVEAQAKAPAAPVKAPKGHKPAKPQGKYVPGGGGTETFDLAPPAEPVPSAPRPHTPKADAKPKGSGPGGTTPTRTK